MNIPPADLHYIAEAFTRCAQEVADTYEDVRNPAVPAQSTPNLLADAMLRLIDVLQRLDDAQIESGPDENSNSVSKPDIDELGDYGLQLLARMSAVAAELNLESRSHEMETLTLPFGLWIARHGGELSTLEPIVNTFAALANSTSDQRQLEELCNLGNEIFDAVSPLITQDTDAANPYRPWRILLLNRAILATRSYRTELMESAFDAIIEFLPGDAAEFFRDGMEQMELLEYPSHVRHLMQRYFDLWCNRRALH